MIATPNPERPRLTFPRSRRLSLAGEFRAVYDARVRRTCGPLAVFAIPNHRPRCRLGLAVGRHVGPAVTRNRVKRRLREAFRAMQHDIPLGLDIVIRVRPHAPARFEVYEAALRDCVSGLAREWRRRQAKQSSATDD